MLSGFSFVSSLPVVPFLTVFCQSFISLLSSVDTNWINLSVPLFLHLLSHFLEFPIISPSDSVPHSPGSLLSQKWSRFLLTFLNCSHDSLSLNLTDGQVQSLFHTRKTPEPEPFSLSHHLCTLLSNPEFSTGCIHPLHLDTDLLLSLSISLPVIRPSRGRAPRLRQHQRLPLHAGLRRGLGDRPPLQLAPR